MTEQKAAAAPMPTVAGASERPDTTAMTDRQLAKAVLDRAIKPRVGEVRRLAEAVVSKGRKKSAKKPKSAKLAKIPGQKKGNKKKAAKAS